MSDFAQILNESDDLDEVETPEVIGDVSTATAGDEDGESQESSEAVASPTAEAASESAASPVTRTEDGYTRDVRGIWHRPDGTIAGKDEIPRLDAAVPVAATPATDGAAPPTPTAPAGSPFQYRALSATHTLEGATLSETGDLRVPAAQVPAIREALNAHHLVQGQIGPVIERYKSRIADLERETQTGTAGEAKANALVQALTAALNIEDDVAAVEQFYQLRAAMPGLMAKAEADYWRTRATQGAPPSTARPETAEGTGPGGAPTSLPDARQALDHTLDFVESVKLEHAYHDVTDADWKQIETQVRRTPFAYFRPATAEDAQRHPGITPGEIVFDTDAVVEHVQQRAAQRKQERETAHAARFNAQQGTAVPVQTKKPQARVAIGSGNGKAPAKGWDQSFNDVWKDGDDE